VQLPEGKQEALDLLDAALKAGSGLSRVDALILADKGKN